MAPPITEFAVDNAVRPQMKSINRPPISPVQNPHVVCMSKYIPIGKKTANHSQTRGWGLSRNRAATTTGVEIRSARTGTLV
jgi:hypothetical protein